MVNELGMTVEQFLSTHPNVMVVQQSDLAALCAVCIIIGAGLAVLGKWVGEYILQNQKPASVTVSE